MFDFGLRQIRRGHENLDLLKKVTEKMSRDKSESIVATDFYRARDRDRASGRMGNMDEMEFVPTRVIQIEKKF